jgi:hypothetical protein
MLFTPQGVTLNFSVAEIYSMCEEKDENDEMETEPVWQDDIEKHEYYYDDATGYEVYTGENEEDED